MSNAHHDLTAPTAEDLTELTICSAMLFARNHWDEYMREMGAHEARDAEQWRDMHDEITATFAKLVAQNVRLFLAFGGAVSQPG